MDKKLNQSKNSKLFGGIIAIILGIIVLSNPYGSVLTITKIVGWVVLIFGVISLVSAFSNFSIIFSQAEFYIGLLCTLFGLAIVMSPQFFVTWIFLLLGIFVMVSGINSLVTANATRALGVPGSNAGFVGAIIAIVFGVIVMLSPYMMASFTMILCGIALLYTGVVNLLDGIRVGKSNS